MSSYVDLGNFVADYDRREANQAALTGDVIGDDDDVLIGDDDTEID